MTDREALPEKARENIFPSPPPRVSIPMFGDIQTIEPRSVIIASPSFRLQITTGNSPPRIS